MDPFEIRDALKTFRILVDRREQNTPRASDRFAAFGVPFDRATLSYGDYCGQITLPHGDLYDTSATIRPAVVVERKMSLDEAAACLGRDRDRFRREFERAREAGAKVYLLVEGGSWEAIAAHRYRSKLNENAFRASLLAWSIRYDFKIVFCKPGSSGALIKEILYREMKEKLECGVFDE